MGERYFDVVDESFLDSRGITWTIIRVDNFSYPGVLKAIVGFYAYQRTIHGVSGSPIQLIITISPTDILDSLQARRHGPSLSPEELEKRYIARLKSEINHNPDPREIVLPSSCFI